MESSRTGRIQTCCVCDILSAFVQLLHVIIWMEISIGTVKQYNTRELKLPDNTEHT